MIILLYFIKDLKITKHIKTLLQIRNISKFETNINEFAPFFESFSFGGGHCCRKFLKIRWEVVGEYRETRGSPNIRTVLGETEEKRIGVILLNLGGPDSLRAVRPFLYKLFSDRKIIRLGPSSFQKPIAWLIASLRSKKTEKIYGLIGGKSPILDITQEQAAALETALNQNSEFRIQNSLNQGTEVSSQESNFIKQESSPPILPLRRGRVRERVTGVKFKVYIGMRYWHPLIEEVVPEISRDGVKKLVALSMYPHYSLATAGSSMSRLMEVIEEYPIEVFSISSWHDHPLYIEALTDVIKRGLDSFTVNSGETEGSKDIQVLFSAHNLPVSLINEGDPYVSQVRGTIKEVVKRLQIKWSLSYQSKSGPVKWLEPSTEETLKRFAKLGYKNILLVPISFVSDHIETLYEIDILYHDIAEQLGLILRRVDALNAHSIFIQALQDMVMSSVNEKGWI
jgi:ferrochelatase